MLLGKAKDNNAATAIGPFVRLFDDNFTLDTVRKMDLSLTVEGTDGFKMTGRSSISQISRDPADLVAQTINAHHHYPDGFVLFLGTMFAPSDDRDVPGRGFTHKTGDIVTISTPELGSTGQSRRGNRQGRTLDLRRSRPHAQSRQTRFTLAIQLRRNALRNSADAQT